MPDDPAPTEYYTVIYRVVGDKAQQAAWWQSIYPMFMATDQAVSVIGVAAFDAMERLDAQEARSEEPHGSGETNDPRQL